jgi:hypothetical protein
VTRLSGLVLAAALVLAGCADDDNGAAPEAEPSGSIKTLTPIPLPPEPPPTGKLFADMRQSSRDAALGRMEVWIDNDTDAAITPTRITYRDGRFRTPLPGTRLREAPSQSERGFPLYLPGLPACGSTATSGAVTVEYGDKRVRIPVEDSTDVVGRYTSARCLEIDVAKVAALSWADQVPPDGDGGEGEAGTLTLVVEPTGRAGGVLTIDTVSGTPVLAPVGSDVWRPEATIRGTDEPTRIDLPIKPNRCDPHAFLESGGATAFKIGLTLDGEPGQITLRMGTEGAANAIRFAQVSCGFDTR